MFGFVAGTSGDEVRRAGRLGAARRGRGGPRVGALRVRSGSGWVDRRHAWIVDARASGTLPLLDRAGRAADRPRARRRLRAAGRIVRREGGVLHERAGTAAGRRRARSRRPATRWKTGRSSSISASRSACRSTTPIAAQVRGDIARAHAGCRRTRGHRRADVRASGGRAPLAAGVESVGAMEVGFHVPGSAAGEGRGRSVVGAAAARRHPAHGSQVKADSVRSRDRESAGCRSNAEVGRIHCGEPRFSSIPVRNPIPILLMAFALSAATAAAQIRRPKADVTPIVAYPAVRCRAVRCERR